MVARRSEARALRDGRRADPGPEGQRAEPGHLGFGRIVALEREGPNMLVNLVLRGEQSYKATMRPSPTTTPRRAALYALMASVAV